MILPTILKNAKIQTCNTWYLTGFQVLWSQAKYLSPEYQCNYTESVHGQVLSTTSLLIAEPLHYLFINYVKHIFKTDHFPINLLKGELYF